MIVIKGKKIIVSFDGTLEFDCPTFVAKGTDKILGNDLKALVNKIPKDQYESWQKGLRVAFDMADGVSVKAWMQAFDRYQQAITAGKCESIQHEAAIASIGNAIFHTEAALNPEFRVAADWQENMDVVSLTLEIEAEEAEAAAKETKAPVTDEKPAASPAADATVETQLAVQTPAVNNLPSAKITEGLQRAALATLRTNAAALKIQQGVTDLLTANADALKETMDLLGAPVTTEEVTA